MIRTSIFTICYVPTPLFCVMDWVENTAACRPNTQDFVKKMEGDHTGVTSR